MNAQKLADTALPKPSDITNTLLYAAGVPFIPTDEALRIFGVKILFCPKEEGLAPLPQNKTVGSSKKPIDIDNEEAYYSHIEYVLQKIGYSPEEQSVLMKKLKAQLDGRPDELLLPLRILYRAFLEKTGYYPIEILPQVAGVPKQHKLGDEHVRKFFPIVGLTAPGLSYVNKQGIVVMKVIDFEIDAPVKGFNPKQFDRDFDGIWSAWNMDEVYDIGIIKSHFPMISECYKIAIKHFEAKKLIDSAFASRFGWLFT